MPVYPASNSKNSFTPIWSGANQGNIAFSGGDWFRGVDSDKGYMIIENLRLEVSGTLGSGSTLTFTLPNSAVIDDTKNPRGTDTSHAGRAYYGRGVWFRAGVGWQPVYAYWSASSPGKLEFRENPGVLLDSSLTFSGQNSSLTFDRLRIPIVGF
jgi:hypothetical protein